MRTPLLSGLNASCAKVGIHEGRISLVLVGAHGRQMISRDSDLVIVQYKKSLQISKKDFLVYVVCLALNPVAE